MAILKGKLSGVEHEVETGGLARASIYPRVGSAAYVHGIRTGLLGAALAADAPIFGVRNGTGAGNALNVYLTHLQLMVTTTTAFTAAQEFGWYGQRFSAANLAGGAATELPVRHYGAGASVMETGGGAGGDIRVSTTTALTSTGVTFDANRRVYLVTWRDQTVNLRHFDEIKFSEIYGSPLKLAPGDGWCIRNLVVWPAAGAAMVHGRLAWEERAT
jgi:hypothetical protein